MNITLFYRNFEFIRIFEKIIFKIFVSYFLTQKKMRLFKMRDIASIKEKYLIDINKNYVPKTAVEARLGFIEKGRNNKTLFTKKNAQQVYREEIQEAKEQYEKQLKNAKEQYQVRLREAKRILKENLASERSGKHERYSTTKEYYKIISNRPEIPIGIKRKRK